jgi:dolichol-phosphate mannosyltransferase
MASSVQRIAPPQSPDAAGPGANLPLAQRPKVSVIVPTYKEVLNIPVLVERLDGIRRAGLDLEVLFMDDDSKDGSAEAAEALGLPWVQLVTRTQDRGLSPAVLDGLRRATGDVLLVMDADLSHPPEAIPAMLDELDAGADFVVGSRFVAGGTTDDDWGIFRWLNSKVATALAAPLAPIKDPMSGFFMLRRSTFLAGKNYNPIGYKIGLELLVKCECKRAVEVPIHFTDRQLGESKLSLKEQLRYLQHIRRLYIYRFALFAQLAQFLVVGVSGLLVNLAVLTVALALNVWTEAAVVLAIFVSMVWNFLLNRRFSFSSSRGDSMFRQFLGFVSACSFGAIVNYWVTIFSMQWIPMPQLAAVVGVAAGTGFNFVASRYWVFRVKHITQQGKGSRSGGPESSQAPSPTSNRPRG